MFKNRMVQLALVILLLPLALLMTACGSEEAEAGLNVGDDAPEFTLPASDGSSVSLSDYSGRPVLLYFHMAVG